MQAVLSELISHLNSSVFILLGILAVVGLTIYKLGRWQEKFINHDRRVDKIESINDNVIKLSTIVGLIYQNTQPKKVVAAASPMNLTSLGEKIALRIGADKIFEKHLQRLMKEINAQCQEDANAYDIQAAAMSIAREGFPRMLSAKDINLIKQEAFHEGILFEDILAVFGIYLRDHALDSRGIPVLDVDKHDPSTREISPL
jgi:hypothetical protein